jgi:hypothetical protein
MNPSPSLPDDSAQTPAVPSEPTGDRPETTEDDWQTVNFPGALDVDAIPTDMTHPDQPAIGTANLFDPEGRALAGANAPLVQQLQQENAMLRSQLFQLEEDLSQAQIELQLEMTRFYCKEAASEVVPQAPEPEAIAQAEAQVQGLNEQIQTLNAQIQELNQALQTTQQSLEQQHSFVAQKEATIQTLTTQLTSSQQRIAQLERDCALSQQRYDEQLQLVSQAENTCQDLRMRLHRQQQQTLQFKAALEKSIEMHAVLSTSQAESGAIADVDLHSDNAEPTFIPKARPVQPWSTSPRLTPHVQAQAKSGGGLANLLAKLAKQPLPDAISLTTPTEVTDSITPLAPAIAPEALPSVPPVDEASKNILEFLFPPQPTTPVENPTPAPTAVFDLSPFIEAGEVDADRISTSEDVMPTEPIGHHPSAPVPAVSAPKPSAQPAGLWADLARLIEPELVDEDPAPVADAAAVTDTNTIALQPDIIPPAPAQIRDVNRLESPLSFVISDSVPQTTNAPEESPVVAHNPFPSFTLHSDDFVANVAIAATSTPETADFVVSHSPSPILYPARQPKKIPSMAAVDLPSFPRP